MRVIEVPVVEREESAQAVFQIVCKAAIQTWGLAKTVAVCSHDNSVSVLLTVALLHAFTGHDMWQIMRSLRARRPMRQWWRDGPQATELNEALGWAGQQRLGPELSM